MYIDNLSNLLVNTKVGCHLGGMCINHLLYADDIVLICPTIKGLNSLLKTCSNYAIQHDIIFNPKKSKCLAVIPAWLSIVNIPHVYLNDTSLPFVDKHSYLGVILNCMGDDTDDMKRQMRFFYAKANSLVREFWNCSYLVKITLFQAYCSSMYCSHLWSVFTKKCVNDVRVAYNNVFRILMRVDRKLSISNTFVNNNIMTFESKQ